MVNLSGIIMKMAVIELQYHFSTVCLTTEYHPDLGVTTIAQKLHVVSVGLITASLKLLVRKNA